MLRFFLDNTLVVNPPKRADSIGERIFYSEQLYCNLSEITGNLIFWSTEYEYIYTQWLDNSCGLVDLEIQKLNEVTNIWEKEFKGFIELADVEFWDDQKMVECEIVDNSFIAMIDNNRSIEMNLTVPLSKNQVDISGEYSSLPTGSVYTYTGGGFTRLTISVWDSFKALIAFMTDNTCEFASDFFDPTLPRTTGNLYYLVNGYELRVHDGVNLPTISFEQLFTDMRRAYNLRIGIEVASSGKPLIRIEPKSYFRNSNYYELSDLKNIRFSRKNGNQYTKILVGNELADQLNQLVIFDYIWNTWKSKEYFLGGQCNEKDVDLDLRLKTVCPDVRAIHDVATGGSTEDSQTFIYAEPSGSDELWNPFEAYAPGTNYNNKSLRNGEIIDRWEDDIFSSVALLQYFVYDMLSSLTSPQTITGTEDIIFDNDSTGGNYDHGNTYDNGTGIYTCVITGTYRIRTTLTLSSAGGTSNFTLGIALGFAGGGEALYWYYPDQSTPIGQTLLTGESNEYTVETEIPLLEGTDIPGLLFPATISIQVNKTGGAGTLTVDEGTFEVFTPASGTFRNFTANDSYSKEITAEGGIPSDMWANMKANRDYKLRIQGIENIHDCYGVDIERNIESGKVTLKGIGKP